MCENPLASQTRRLLIEYANGVTQISATVSPQPGSSTPAPVGFVLLLLLGILFYVPMVAAMWSGPGGGNPAVSSGEDRMGLAWAEFFALLFGIPLWLVLGGLLRIAAKHGQMPSEAAFYAVVLWMLSACAAWASALAYFKFQGGWSVLVPALLPALIAGYAAWVRLPSLVAFMAPKQASFIGLGAIALVAAAAVPLEWLDAALFPARVARAEQEQQAADARAALESARQRQDEASKFRTLNPASALADYLPFIADRFDHPPERHEQALAGARLVGTRQDDAVRLLDQQQLLSLDDLWQLNLQVTPALCVAYDNALRRFAEDPAWYDSSAVNLLELQLPNIEFLIGGHCNLDVSLGAAAARMEKALASLVQDDRRADWQKFHDTLVAMRRPHQ